MSDGVIGIEEAGLNRCEWSIKCVRESIVYSLERSGIFETGVRVQKTMLP